MLPAWLDLSSRKAALAVSVLGIVMAARIAATYPVFNATIDEGLHIASGIEIYQQHRYTLLIEQPPLSRFPIGLAAYLGGARIQPSGNVIEQGRHVLENSAGYWKTLTLGRLGNLAFLLVLVFYVYRWSARLWGRKAGAAAVIVVTTSPSVLAHAGLATIDLAITATLIGAAYHLYRWFEQPSFRNACAAGVLSGLALMAKYSAAGFLPLILGGYLILTVCRTWPYRRTWNLAAAGRLLTQAALCGLCAVLVIWLSFAVNDTPQGDEVNRRYGSVERRLPGDSLLAHLATGSIRWVRATAPGFLEGLHRGVTHAAEGHSQQYLLGEIRTGQGWWYYFPVALAVKSTLACLLLVCASLVFCGMRREDRGRSKALYPAFGAAAVLAVAMGSEINIGVRHILPAWPFLAVLASSLFERTTDSFRAPRPLLAASSVLLAAHVVASVVAHPDYLPYFNEFGRGREHRILSDSNLDWGQDLNRLARYVEDHGIEQVHLSYFGTTSPAMVGLHGVKSFHPEDRPSGWAAVSVSHLQGLGLPAGEANFEWLSAQEPYAKIGKSIRLYRLGPRATTEPMKLVPRP